MSLSLLIVDDHEGVARALAELLGVSGFDPVHVAHSVTVALGEARRERPDVVTVDLDLGGEDGLKLVGWLRAEQPHLPIVILTATSTTEAAVASVRAGATGFVPKSATSDDLVTAIRLAAEGHSWLPRALVGPVMRRLMEPEPLNDWEQLVATLSAREREVLELMVDGLSRREIGTTLSISLNTVRTHIKSILAKLGVHASLEAVSLALRAGLRPGAHDARGALSAASEARSSAPRPPGRSDEAPGARRGARPPGSR